MRWRWFGVGNQAKEGSLRKLLFSTAILTLGLAACGAPEATGGEALTEGAAADPMATPTMQAMALLATADGEQVGSVTATSAGEGVLLAIDATGMPAGLHGVHVHTTGACTPDFDAAGGHWNPSGESHGIEDPAGQHAGDMPNLEVGEDGSGTLEYTLGGGATFESLMDADGAAFVVHAGEDDQVTDPSGNSGDRIACGVFETASAEVAGAAAM